MSVIHLPNEGPKLIGGEHRWRVPVSKAAQDALRRPLRHVIDQPPGEWPHRGRLDFGRLETLLERFLDAEAAQRSALYVTRREASTLLAWTQFQQQARRDLGSEISTAEALIARLEFMLGLRADLPGRVPGQPIHTPKIPPDAP